MTDRLDGAAGMSWGGPCQRDSSDSHRQALQSAAQRGSMARRAVVDVAGVLGVDLGNLAAPDTWTPTNLQRVVDGVEELKRERDDHWAQADLWKSLAERQDNTAPLRSALRIVERERDEARRERDVLRDRETRRWHTPSRIVWTTTAEEVTTTSDDLLTVAVTELRNVIVSQAREIARLKGESE